MNMLKSGLVLASLLVGANASSAFAEVKAGESYVEMGDWRYTPILDTNRSGQPVSGFLGLLNPAVSVGGNITAIWYSRDAAGAWTSKAWIAEDEWKVIESIKAASGISSVYDSNWAAWGPKSLSATPSGQTAALYEKGFLVGDPVGDIARQSEQFNDVVEFLKDAGYPTAVVKFEKENLEQCEPNYVLNWMSSVATVTESNVKTEASVSNAMSALACGWDWLWPHWTWTTVPAPAWGPTPAGPPALGPGWSPPTPGSNGTTAGNCTYTATVTQSRTRTRVRNYVGIGTATCVETQTQTCTYSVTCLNDASGPGGGCAAQPTCATTPAVTCSDGAWSSCW